MPDNAAYVSLAYSPTAVAGETSNVSSPALKRHLLAENEFAFLKVRPSSYRCISVRLIYKANIFYLSKNNLLRRDLLLLILFGCLPEVKLGPRTRACAVTFVYVVAVETVYK